MKMSFRKPVKGFTYSWMWPLETIAYFFRQRSVSWHCINETVIWGVSSYPIGDQGEWNRNRSSDRISVFMIWVWVLVQILFWTRCVALGKSVDMSRLYSIYKLKGNSFPKEQNLMVLISLKPSGRSVDLQASPFIYDNKLHGKVR